MRETSTLTPQSEKRVLILALSRTRIWYEITLAEGFSLWQAQWFCGLISLIKLEWVGDKKTFYYYDNNAYRAQNYGTE